MSAQWLLWVALALAACVAEILSLDLIFGMIAGGALLAAGVAAFTGNTVAAVLSFAVGSALLLAVVRPLMLRYVDRVGSSLTGVRALVGREALVVREVGPSGGEVKLAGEVWTARVERPGDVLETGSRVLVSAIDGATAVVRPVRALPGAAPDGPAGDPGAGGPVAGGPVAGGPVAGGPAPGAGPAPGVPPDAARPDGAAPSD